MALFRSLIRPGGRTGTADVKFDLVCADWGKGGEGGMGEGVEVNKADR